MQVKCCMYNKVLLLIKELTKNGYIGDAASLIKIVNKQFNRSPATIKTYVYKAIKELGLIKEKVMCILDNGSYRLLNEKENKLRISYAKEYYKYDNLIKVKRLAILNLERIGEVTIEDYNNDNSLMKNQYYNGFLYYKTGLEKVLNKTIYIKEYYKPNFM